MIVLTPKEKILKFLTRIGTGEIELSEVNLRDVESGVFGGSVIDFQAEGNNLALLVEGNNSKSYLFSLKISQIERIVYTDDGTNDAET